MAPPDQAEASNRRAVLILVETAMGTMVKVAFGVVSPRKTIEHPRQCVGNPQNPR